MIGVAATLMGAAGIEPGFEIWPAVSPDHLGPDDYLAAHEFGSGSNRDRVRWVGGACVGTLVLMNHSHRTLVSGLVALLKLEQHLNRIERGEGNGRAGDVAKSMFLAEMSHEIRTPSNRRPGAYGIARRDDARSQAEGSCSRSPSSVTMLLALVTTSWIFRDRRRKLEIHHGQIQVPELAGSRGVPFQRWRRRRRMWPSV